MIDRLTAALSDRYRIERELGAGGMATVYLAADLKHDRKVAIKVLTPELGAVVGAERFLAEIRTTANLRHPHILPLFDSGEADGLLWYAMPYVEGESLRDRLDREKQLPVKEAVAIASKVAGALQAAHDAGVIHRDIKPANILLERGEPTVADFGIALAVQDAGGGRLTETGLSLGTPHYMSPEQATGDRESDARTDVHALGAVLYEMLTGEPPFPGATAQAIVGRILTVDPTPPTEIRRSVPPNVEAAVLTALEKTPADRFRTAGEFANALNDPGFIRPATGARDHETAHGPLFRYGWPATAAVLAVALIGVLLAAPEPRAPRVIRAPLALSPGQELGDRSGIGLAPDLSFFVYRGTVDQDEGLWVRRFDETDARPIPGSAGGRAPQVSPEGDRVAFATWDGVGWSLNVTSLSDGTVEKLTDELGADVVAWGPGDLLYFQGADGLWRIPASGGTAERVVVADSTLGERTFGRPFVLPEGRGILMTTVGAGPLAVLDLRTGTAKRLGVRGSFPMYAPGYLVYADDGEVLAAPFDLDRLEVTGEPRRLPLTPRASGFGAIEAAISPTGDLVYVSTERRRIDMVWVSRGGLAEPVDPSWQGSLRYPRVSPDGGRIIGEMTGPDGRTIVGLRSLEAAQTRLISTDTAEQVRPEWHPEGDRIVYRDQRGLVTVPLDGRLPTVLESDIHRSHAIWGPDGTTLVVDGRLEFDGERHLYSRGAGAESTPRHLLPSEEGEQISPALSPNGRHLAYVWVRAGRGNVVVRPYPDLDSDRVQVTFSGRYSPAWSRDGTELFFHDAQGQMFAAQVTTGGAFGITGIEPLLSGAGYDLPTWDRGFDVHPDGGRFLMVRRQGDEVVLVLNWLEELRAFMGGS
jgi:serine/threonine-protein kinase